MSFIPHFELVYYIPPKSSGVYLVSRKEQACGKIQTIAYGWESRSLYKDAQLNKSESRH